jgi:hypothetical protein
MSVFGKCRGGGRRSAERVPLPLAALLTSVGRTRRAELLDISCTGIRVRGRELPAEGEDLQIKIESVRAFGTVMWVDGQQCGVAFECPLMPFEVDSLRRQASLPSFAGLAVEDRLAAEDWLVGRTR